jgi:hypothetical protein
MPASRGGFQGRRKSGFQERKVMASAAPVTSQLPLLYAELEPLSSNQHGGHRLSPQPLPEDRRNIHAVPLTVEEFVLAQRFFPIVFSVGPNPVPLALMGLNEGVNLFFDADGDFREDTYAPAYLRRWPFLLARLRPDSDELSLCFDPSAGSVAEGTEGEALFDEGQPSETTKGILAFCEQFEQAGARTAAFIKELQDLNLLMDGEVAIQAPGATQPFVYRGFQMVSEEKLRELRGDQLRRINQSGLLALIHAHLFSLSLIRDLFARQQAAGMGPVAAPASDIPS